MTSYAPNFTSRYRVKYNVCGIDHTIQLRKAIGATAGETALLAGTVNAIFTAAAGSLQLADDFTFLSAEQADEDSDVFYPSTLPDPVVGTVALSLFTPFQKVTHTRFQAKARGSRTSIEMYGLLWEYASVGADADAVGYDGKVSVAERAFVGTIAALLNSQAFANSGGPTTWYSRATIKINDFWLRAVRSGGIT